MYPVTYQAPYPQRQSRPKAFFRLLLAIPWFIVACLWSLLAFFAVVIAWFAVVITGRYPQDLYNFVSGVLRYFGRVNGWVLLQADEWPAFGLKEEEAYPIRVRVAPRAGAYSRLKAGFRLILAIPAMILQYLLGAVAQAAAIVSWIVIVFTASQPELIHKVIAFAQNYQMRALAYVGLVSERYPPISGPDASPALPSGSKG